MKQEMNKHQGKYHLTKPSNLQLRKEIFRKSRNLFQNVYFKVNGGFVITLFTGILATSVFADVSTQVAERLLQD